MDVEASQELAEATTLLENAKGPRVRKALSDLVASLQRGNIAEAATAAPADCKADAIRETTTSTSTSTTAVNAAAPPAESDSNGVPAAVSGSHLPETTGEAAAEADAVPPSVPVPTSPKAASRTAVEGGVPAPPRLAERRYATVEKFAWDQGGYNSPKVSVYVPLDGVGAVKERVSCSFTTRGFDLTVIDLDGKSYRLLQNNLDKDIVPDESKIVVKKNKILVKLQKVKGEFGSYDSWTTLAAKKAKKVDVKSNPQAGLMDMMKDMYDEGDDSTKKLIGEAMMKSQQGRGSAPGSAFDKPDFGSDYGLGGSGRAKSSSSSSSSAFDALGSGGGLSAAGGLNTPAGNFDSMMDDLNMDLDKDPENGGWGAGGKDDFGFGSAKPPPGSSDPVPAAADEDDVVEAATKQGEESKVASEPSASLPAEA